MALILQERHGYQLEFHDKHKPISSTISKFEATHPLRMQTVRHCVAGPLRHGELQRFENGSLACIGVLGWRTGRQSGRGFGLRRIAAERADASDRRHPAVTAHENAPATPDLVEATLALFGYDQGNLDPRIPSAIAEAGATHLVVTLKSRERLAAVLMIWMLDAT